MKAQKSLITEMNENFQEGETEQYCYGYLNGYLKGGNLLNTYTTERIEDIELKIETFFEHKEDRMEEIRFKELQKDVLDITTFESAEFNEGYSLALKDFNIISSQQYSKLVNEVIKSKANL